MIKVYCDKCGKEITGNVNRVFEEEKATDAKGNVITIFSNETHICDECQYEDLTCGFKVGDQVITDNGRVGIIESFCDCDRCRDRGFYEPKIKMEIGDCQIYITDNDKRVGFNGFYSIGDRLFGNIDKQCVLDAIEYKKKEIKDAQKDLVELECQLAVVNKLR
jgi:hypothetical protein